MKQYTQTSLEAPYGNCWQTAVACILDVDPAALPSQAKHHDRYLNQLNAYLGVHHNLMYTCFHEHYWRGVLHLYGHYPRGYYCWEGETVRTPINKSDHVVVAKDDRMVWDVHPSRAGLTTVKRWGVLGSIPEEIRKWREKRLADGDKDFLCVCPTCLHT